MAVLDILQSMFGQTPTGVAAPASAGIGNAPGPHETDPNLSPIMQFLQQSSLAPPQVDPKADDRRAVQRGLLNASAGLISNPSDNFLTSLARGANAGAGGYLDSKDASTARDTKQKSDLLEKIFGLAGNQALGQYRQDSVAARLAGIDQRSDPKWTQIGVDKDGNAKFGYPPTFDPSGVQTNGTPQNTPTQIEGGFKGKPPAGYKWNDDGTMGFIKGGPADPDTKSTLKQPRALTSVDKNAILEADDQVQAGKNTIGLLEQALSMNDKAGSGYMADAQAFAARNDPTGFFDKEKGAATTDFNNIVMGQALASMKSIFGGNPTEGERSVLLQLQGMADKTPDERAAIINRGIDLAKRRVVFNTDRAKEIRSGEYFGGASTVSPQQDTSQDQGDSGDGAAPSQNGLEVGKIVNGHQYLGGDLKKAESWKAAGSSPAPQPGKNEELKIGHGIANSKIPEGATVKDNKSGRFFKKVNGQLVPVQ